jgi:uncharacterized membrane protein
MFGDYWPRIHAALNDLPIALLVTAVFFELIAMATGRAVFRQVSFWTLLIGVLGGVAAVVSGLQAEDLIAHGDAVHRVMKTHQTLGFISVGIFALVAVWRIARESRMVGFERALVLALSLGGVGAVFATGLYGGRLVFDHAAGITRRVLEDELAERTKGHQHQGEEAMYPIEASDSAASAPDSHVDPPGTPAHSHPPGTPPHRD